MFAKRKAPTTLASPAVKQSAKALTKTRIDETRTAVSTAGSISNQPPQSSAAEPIEISSGSSDDDEYDQEEDASDAEDQTSKPKQNGLPPPASTPSKTLTNGGDTEMADLPSDEDDSAEPTLGDLLRGSTTVDVSTSLQQKQNPLPLTKQPQALVPAPTLSSLGTVLNQALRTDDSDLLESCLSTNDLPTVRATIERLDSALAGTLLSKLASRMHRRPGRAHSLMTWVQWTLVAHGGALAGRADLLSRLSELNRVLEERSRGLGSLLALKGKLDMLDSQMQLRRESRARRRGEEEDVEDEEEEEEEGMIYVEGEEEEGEDGKVNGVKRIGGDEDEGLANGIGGDSDEEEDSEEESDEDVDAERAVGGEDLDENEVDFDDVEESGDDESEAEVEAPPAKMAKTSKKGRRG
ncbi:NUC189-domain-containing protein [Coniochaeta sp. PMI_546]|nr:NUC189-domain-containing protein [Coniochaeta sp. PMI_546]